MGTRYGLLTAREAITRGYVPAKIFLNGEEVLKPVAVVNDTEGWIDVYAEDLAYEGGSLAPRLERLYGDVIYVPRGSLRVHFNYSQIVKGG